MPGLDPAWKVQESTARYQLEVFNNAGVIMGAIAYGMNILIYLSAMYAVWTAPNKRHAWLLSITSTFLFVCAGLNMIANALAEQWTYIDYRGYPKGPVLFIERVGNIAPNVLGQIAGVLVTWAADAVLLWRCYTIWKGRFRVWIIILPVVMWLATIGLGIITCYQIAQPELTIASLGTVNYNLSFWAIAVSLNMLLTTFILIRLLKARMRAVSAFGRDHGTTYTSAAAIIVESAVPYAIFGFLWIITYGVHNRAAPAFLPILIQFEAISPELIVLRIARGKAWTTKTEENLTGTSDHRTLHGGSTHGGSTHDTDTFAGSRDVLPIWIKQSREKH